MPQFKDEHVLLIAPGSQTTLAQLGLPESFTPASHRFPTRMFPAEKKGEYEPFKIREKKKPATSTSQNTNGQEKPDVEMTEAPKQEEGAETANDSTEEKNPGTSNAAPAEGTNGNGGAETNSEEAEPKEETFLEEDIISDEGAIYPIQNGHIVDWPCFLALLEHVYNTLSPPFHTPVLIISEPAWTARDREILTQFIFEKFKPPAFCLMDSALAACYAYGTVTATVVDVGYGKANVTAVLESVVQDQGRGIALEGCGGETMTDRLEELLKPKGFTREMCEQLKRSNITEILPPGTPLPGSTGTSSNQNGANPAAAASTGSSEANNASKLPRGPGRGTQTENNENGDDDEGVLDVAAIITSGNTTEFLAKREKEKAVSGPGKKGGADANKPTRLPNSKRETATFQFEEFVRIEDSVQYVRQRREIEVGPERFLLASPGKDRMERGSGGILEDLAAQIHHTILAVPDAAKRSDLWDNLIIIGNGSRIRGFVPALLSTITQKYILSPSAGIFTSEIPSNISTPMATGTTTPANLGSQTPNPLPYPAAHGVNPLLVAATHANTPGMQENQAYLAMSSMHRSTGHSQTPTSVKTVKPPDYFPEWKDQGGSNAPGATGAGGTNTTSANPAGAPRPGMEESVFLGAQIAAKIVFVNDSQGQYKGYLPRAEYNDNGPSAIHEWRSKHVPHPNIYHRNSYKSNFSTCKPPNNPKNNKMPRAEAGSTKAISNKLKSRGLTRLRWYCQPCEKACRDENGFKCHVQSESHVRQMLLIGENSKAAIDKYSAEFLKEFIDLLRTSHGEKKVHINHFYQQVISNKSHTHMNATKWTSLTQFAAYLGREGIARVEETEKGLFISWIDNRPETLRRREAVMKKERQDRGDEEREQRQIQEQVERARKAELAKAAADKSAGAGAGSSGEESEEKTAGILERKEGEKVKLSFGAKPAMPTSSGEDKAEEKSEEKPEGPAKTAISFSSSTSKPKNVFSLAKPNAVKPSNAFASVKKSTFVPQQQKISQQEMIMRKEMEAMEQKKRKFGGNVFDAGKKQRVS
ncbi:chromatin remodeling complex subunit (Arp9), putative [Talaromyces stipitatus ATCC 10500]|uniref:Chromatin remodeling complex subunit (Arp9), putative n=1 Tax=Talaromyces stipitatus (strain ATCC 10500 / CBS 375.48 / QM 6759 / NRRL 1006) TaxID=441959 RepID=B8MNX3_TALSN|nr:chromatin remodeling complex subunit (Arp9), putative [Talaromyces stipitatus ATCC 10500]EED14212.1 chromatin remodeling complex subunit (Arp9), putative [Talaromyces stipitatus ATCC 10500]